MQPSSCNSTGKCLHGKGDTAGTQQAPSPPVRESWNLPNNVGTTGIFSRKASFFLCCHFSPDCLSENDLLDSRSKLTSPDELVIKLKYTFWILSRGTRSPDMITHGFTNLAMTKPSPSLTKLPCWQQKQPPQPQAPPPLQGGKWEHPNTPLTRPGVLDSEQCPKAANTSLWAGFWRPGIAAGLEFPGSWWPERSWRLLEHLTLQAGHSWAAHPGAAPKKALHETNPAQCPLPFFKLTLVN